MTIAETSITNADLYGILFNRHNRVDIADTAVTNASVDGISFFSDNTVTLENSALVGTFGDEGIDISDTGNELSGAGNTAAGATFGGQFCQAVAGQTGQFTFDIGSCPP